MSDALRDSLSGSDSDDLVKRIDEVVDGFRAGRGQQTDDAVDSADELQDLMPMMKLLAEVGNKPLRKQPPAPHDVRLGDFQLLRELGRGGMGFVFEAIQVSMNRRVALKILPHAATLDPTILARFEREAQAAATLEHPHIVRAYARGHEQGTYYLAMQLIRGQDLSRFICRRRSIGQKTFELPRTDQTTCSQFELSSELDSTGELNVATETSTHRRTPGKPDSDSSSNNMAYFRSVARIGQRVAEALQYAHENGVVHRDIKPSNLLLDEEGTVWVADFGLASLDVANQVTVTGKVLGTLRYSSPEQACGARDLDARTDVYSLGATLYELATLHPAFEDRGPAAVLKSILEEEPTRPRRIAPKLPNDLESVILKAMAKSPRHRYQTALELAVDLQRFIRNEPVHAKRPTAIGRSIRWVQRNRVMSLLAAALLLLLVSFVSGVIVHFGNQRELLTRLNKSNEMVESEIRLSRERYYAADLANIARLADSGEYEVVRRRLQQHVPQPGQKDLRGFLWRYLDATASCVDLQLDAHQHEVLSTALAPRLNLLASGDKLGTIYLWDIATWQQRTMLSFAGEVQDLEFSPDEELLAVCGTEGVIQLYSTGSWDLIQTIAGHDMTAKGVEFTPDGRTLISASRDHDIGFWDTETWQLQRRFIAHDTVQHISMSADGRWLASGGDDGLTKVWDVQSGELATELGYDRDAVLATAISSDGRLVATGGYNHWLHLYDRGTEETLTHIPLDWTVWSLRFLLDDRSLMVGIGNGEVRIFDIRDPRQPRLSFVDTIHGDRVRSFEFLEDSRQFVSVSDDTSIRVTSLPTNRSKRTLDASPARFARFAPDGRYFALGQFGGRFSLFDRNFVELATHTMPGSKSEPRKHGCPRLAFDPNDLLWAATFEETTAHFAHLTPSHEICEHAVPHDREFVGIWLSNDACYAFAIDTADQGILWMTDGLRELARFSVPPEARAVAFSPDNTTLAIATTFGEVLLKDLRGSNNKQLIAPQSASSELNTISFDPSGSVVAAVGSKGTVHIWDAKTGRVKQEMVHHYSVSDIAFSSDGRYLISASNDLRLWHVDTGQFLSQLGQRDSYIRYECVTFSPADDCLVATADYHGEVLHIWDTRGISK